MTTLMGMLTAHAAVQGPFDRDEGRGLVRQLLDGEPRGRFTRADLAFMTSIEEGKLALLLMVMVRHCEIAQNGDGTYSAVRSGACPGCGRDFTSGQTLEWHKLFCPAFHKCGPEEEEEERPKRKARKAAVVLTSSSVDTVELCAHKKDREGELARVEGPQVGSITKPMSARRDLRLRCPLCPRTRGSFPTEHNLLAHLSRTHSIARRYGRQKEAFALVQAAFDAAQGKASAVVPSEAEGPQAGLRRSLFCPRCRKKCADVMGLYNHLSRTHALGHKHGNRAEAEELVRQATTKAAEGFLNHRGTAPAPCLDGPAGAAPISSPGGC